MRLSIQFSLYRRYDIEFGYKTALFEGMYWFSIIVIDLDGYGNVEFGAILFDFLKHPKYWFNNWSFTKKKAIYAPYELKEDDLLSCCEDCGGLNGEHWEQCPSNRLNN